MATVLQRQLAAIAANSTHQLDLKAQKAAHGKSLLFEPKVATTQDFNTLYQICVEGFEELCTLDPRFRSFAQNIFSEQSRSEERGLMTKEENEELDNVLGSFLSLVTGRLLLKPAQKAVEWVIRRFRIHEHNTETLILVFLPYHTTPLFSSLLQILPKQIPHAFRFLYPSISALENPTSHTLLYTATNTPAFFDAFNKFTLKACRARHHSPAVMSFWASLTTQAVDGMMSAAQSGRETIHKQRQEEVLLRILPILDEAFSPQLADVSELVLAGCMIATVLGVKGSLEDHILDGLMDAVSMKFTPATTEARMTCLAVLAEERRAIELPQLTTRKLLRLNNLGDYLLVVSEKVPVGRLVLGLILRYLKIRSKSGEILSSETIDNILRANILSEAQIYVLLDRTISLAIQQAEKLSEEKRGLITQVIDFAGESSTLQSHLQAITTQSATNRSQIEVALQTTLPLPIEDAVENTQEDQNMLDAPPSTSKFDSTLETLSKHELSSQSFLSLDDTDDFGMFSAAYAQALKSENRLAKLIQKPALQAPETSLSLPVITFFIRISADQTATQTSRITALRCLQRLIKKEGRSSAQTQFLIPYLIAGLIDRSGSIRQAVADTIIALAGIYGSPSGEVAGPTVIEEEPYPWQSLQQDVARLLLQKAVIPHLEEAVLDPKIIITALVTVLKGNGQLVVTHCISICIYLACHAVGTTLHSVKLSLLKIVNLVGTNASIARSEILEPMLSEWLSAPLLVIDWDKIGIEARKELEIEILRVISAEDQSGLDFLANVVSGQLDSVRQAMIQPAFVRLAEIWTRLPAQESERFANVLLDATLRNIRHSTSDLYYELASETIRIVKLPGHILMSLVESLPNALNMPDAPPAAKRRRTSRSEMARISAASPSDIATALAKYTLVLELVDNSKPEEYPELLNGLFHVLEELQHYKMQTQSGLVYLQGLAIGCLLAIVDRLKETQNSTVDKSFIRADLIVDCIRNSTNSQVQSTALLLISSLASWQPETVVHSIMPIFTFMGNTILRQGDDYSAHVTEKTVSRVVPPLVESFRKKNTDIVRGAANLLLSFTAAFEHIPSHRRLGLFEHVARTLGPEESLYAILAMLNDGYPADRRAKKFIGELMNAFDPSVGLTSVKKYLDLVGDIFRQRHTISNHVLNISERPKDQFENIASNLLDSLAELLEDRQLRNRMAISFGSGDLDTANAQRLAYAELMQEAIRMSQFLRSKPSLVKPAAKALSNIFNLLPTVDLVQCASALLTQSDDDVRRVVLSSVHGQLRDIKLFSTDDITALLGFISTLTSLLGKSKDTTFTCSAILCIDHISMRFGKKDTDTIIAAAQIISSNLTLKSSDLGIQTASTSCLITMLDVLRNEFIPLIPGVLPLIFAYLEQSTVSEQIFSAALAKNAFAFICMLTEHLAFLLTGDDLDTALRIAQKSAAHAQSRIACKVERDTLYRLLAANADANELFAAFERNLTYAMENSGYEALLEYFVAIKTFLGSRSKASIIKNSSKLFGLLLQSFDHSRLASSPESHLVDISDEKMDRLQDIYNDVALTMVMKLNDATFRPFIIKLTEWADNLPKKDEEGKMLRATSMFSFLALLFGRFKSLVTSYAIYILDLAADVITNTSPTSAHGEKLLTATLSALEESFTHDDEQFYQSPHHFNPLATPLTTFLSQPISSQLSEKVQSAIFALASATSSQDQHKQMNMALLKLLRHDEAAVRLAAVKTERTLCEKLGEEWLAMLPEMLPYVAEVLEDDDTAVERAGREWVRFLEGVLGESLEF